MEFLLLRMVHGIVQKQAEPKFSLFQLKKVKPVRWKFLPQAGFLNKKTGTYHGRPVDVAIMKDGSITCVR